MNFLALEFHSSSTFSARILILASDFLKTMISERWATWSGRQVLQMTIWHSEQYPIIGSKWKVQWDINIDENRKSNDFKNNINRIMRYDRIMKYWLILIIFIKNNQITDLTMSPIRYAILGGGFLFYFFAITSILRTISTSMLTCRGGELQ